MATQVNESSPLGKENHESVIEYSVFALSAGAINKTNTDWSEVKEEQYEALQQSQQLNGAAGLGLSQNTMAAGQAQSKGIQAGAYGQMSSGISGVGAEGVAGAYEIWPDKDIRPNQDVVNRLDGYQKAIDNTKPADRHLVGNGSDEIAANNKKTFAAAQAVERRDVVGKDVDNDFINKIAHLKSEQNAVRDSKDSLDRVSKNVANKRKEFQGKIDSKNQLVQSRAGNLRSYGRYAGQLGQGIGDQIRAKNASYEANARSNIELDNYNKTTAEATQKGINGAVDTANETQRALRDLAKEAIQSNRI